MDPIKYPFFRGMLLDLRAEYARRAESIQESGLGIPAQQSIQELSMYDNHPADVGSETFERGKDLGLKINAEYMIRKIDYALDVLDQGKYGTCQTCGQPISEERLLAVPYATHCARCQQVLDDQLHRSRPVEEDVVPMPFGDYSLVKDYVGYDGQDAWEDASLGGSASNPQDQPGSIDYDDMRDTDEPGMWVRGGPKDLDHKPASFPEGL